MNKKKSWVPAVAPLRSDLSAWKIICHDIHDGMIDAGMIQTSDTGQSSFDDVATFPAFNTYPCYRMYRWEVAGQPDVFIKLTFGAGEFGTGSDVGYRSPNYHSYGVQIGLATDGAGNLTAGERKYVFPNAQVYTAGNGTGAAGPIEPGVSVYCRNDAIGFFGFGHGLGSMRSVSAPGRNFNSSNLAFFLHRVAGKHVSIFSNGIGNLGYENNAILVYNMTSGIIQTISYDSGLPISPATNFVNVMVRGVRFPANLPGVFGDKMFLIPAINTSSSEFEILPGLLSCNQDAIFESATFETMVGDSMKTFLRLPLCGVHPGSDGAAGSAYSPICMLFDDTP